MMTAVIFDMDGVIADSEYLNVKAKHIQLQMAGVNVDWHYHDKFLGTTHEFMWTEMKKEFGLKEEVPYYIDQWVEVRKKLVEEEGLKPMPGVVDLIHGLKENGFKLAVASSSLKEDIMKNMDLFGITDYFDAFISGSECENGKPDPEIFLKAAEALGKKPEECIVVEDSTAGVHAAKSAGMYCIGYAPEDAPRVDEFFKPNETVLEDIDLGQIRIDMKRESEDITTEEIIETTKIIALKDHMIEITIYERKDQKDSKEKRKLALFIHGGGFIGGDVRTKGNQCRYLAQQSGAVVISPEYRLAPETPYPGAEIDVIGTIDWIEENAERLNIDTDKMAIMGESAGGHLAINTCLKDEKQRMKLAVSVYGVMDLSKAEDTPYHWDYSLYQMAEEQKDYIMNRLFRFKELNDSMNDLYLQNGESTLDGEVSPLFSKHLDCLPKVLMIEAEFDYFRVCNQEFEKRMQEAGKDFDVIYYEGLDHGFFDRLGSLPQTQDCIDEIAKYIKEM